MYVSVFLEKSLTYKPYGIAHSGKGTWFQQTAMIHTYIDEWSCQWCKVIYLHEPPDEIFCIQICASHLSAKE